MPPVSDLAPKDRLQPALLDRLTDDEPDKGQESRERRVLTIRRLRDGVRRDLTWLLNTVCLGATEDLSPYPLLSRSVLNYGLPDLAGTTATSTDPGALERALRDAVRHFEPRILPQTLRVTAAVDQGQMSHRALTFVIQGELYAQPTPLALYLRTEVDLEAGTVRVTEGRPA